MKKRMTAWLTALILVLLPLCVTAETNAVDLFVPADFLTAWETCMDAGLVAQLAEQTEQKEADVRSALTLSLAEELTDASVPCRGYSNAKKSMVLYFGGTADADGRAEYIVCDSTNETFVRIFALMLEMVCADCEGLYTWTKTAPAEDSYVFGPYYFSYRAEDTYTMLMMEVPDGEAG